MIRFWMMGCPRDLHAHVAAGNHHGIGKLDDVVDVFNALGVFYLGDDAYVRAAVFVQQPAHLQQVLAASDKGSRHIVEPRADAEPHVLAVDVADVGQGQVHARHVDALAAGHLARRHHAGDDVGVGDVLHRQLHQAVVDQNAGVALHVLRQALVRDGHDVLVAGDVPGGQRERIAGVQHDGAGGKVPQADFGAAGVQQGGDRHVQLAAHPADNAEHGQVAAVAGKEGAIMPPAPLPSRCHRCGTPGQG